MGVPTDNRRLARHRSIKDGFRRSDPEAGPDKGRQEAVKLHVREPRHAPLAARGLGKRQDAGNRVRIIVKRFPEIPDAQEQNARRDTDFSAWRAARIDQVSIIMPLFTAFVPRSNSRDESVASKYSIVQKSRKSSRVFHLTYAASVVCLL